ncbi:hypothetical protein PROFUN_02612 [Planoprotostelium fungivorum]|uniref:Uncharacterized protein n=1 Tax=Planoprotostelium fungivorum TaxID=1890364 RepID=A0A2P6NV79_9EUKA|nr:hypothetical protein PROFUN_02612 [Planoprotostelium fungivorum]
MNLHVKIKRTLIDERDLYIHQWEEVHLTASDMGSIADVMEGNIVRHYVGGHVRECFQEGADYGRIDYDIEFTPIQMLRPDEDGSYTVYVVPDPPIVFKMVRLSDEEIRPRLEGYDQEEVEGWGSWDTPKKRRT